MSDTPRPDFTALRARRGALEFERSNAVQRANDGVFQNKIEMGVELWLSRVSKEIAEIDWVLDYFSHEPPPPPPPTKAPLTHSAAAFIALVWFGLLASIYLGLLIFNR